MRPQRLNVRRLGLDLDNTLIDYTDSLASLASDFGIAREKVSRDEIRTQLRRPDDDEEWQHFQSLLYTEGLASAWPAFGAMEFIRACRRKGVEVFIVSHKTERGPKRFGARDLRSPALEWLAHRGLVPGLIPADRVFFADSVKNKIDWIAKLKLDVFVDDLPEILSHPQWPTSTLGVRFSPQDLGDTSTHWCVDFPKLSKWLDS